MPSVTYDFVFAQLQPYVGEKMARALIQMHCQSNGLPLERQNLTAFAGRLETALKVFVGSARAAAVVRSIRGQG